MALWSLKHDPSLPLLLRIEAAAAAHSLLRRRLRVLPRQQRLAAQPHVAARVLAQAQHIHVLAHLWGTVGGECSGGWAVCWSVCVEL